MNQPQTSELIRELRLLMGLTQEQFAAKLGVTYSSVNRWENGRSKLSPMALKLVEDMLHQTGDRGRQLLEKYRAK